MKRETAIKLFSDRKVRVHWDTNKEKWYFFIVNIIEFLTESKRSRKYRSDLKKKLK